MAGNYKIGQIVEGKTGSYRFKGGNAKDKNNWELISYPGVMEQETETESVPAKPKTTAGEALSLTFPSTTKGKGILRKGAGLVSDIVSAPGRYGSAMDRLIEYARAKSPEERQLKAKEIEQAFKGESPDFVRLLIESPEAGAGAMAAPFTGGLSLKGTLGKMAVGGIEGIAAGSARQAKRYAETGKVSPAEAGIDVAAGTLIPAGGAMVKKGGQSLIRPILKPKDVTKRELKKKGMELGRDIFQRVFGKDVTSGIPGAGGVKQIRDRAVKAEKELLTRFNAIKDANKNVEIDMGEAFDRALVKLQDEIDAGKHFDIEDMMPNVVKKWQNKMVSGDKEVVTLPVAIELRRSLDAASKWEFDEKATKRLVAEARFARLLRKELNESQIHAKVPDLIQVDQSLSHGYPIEHALEDAVERIENNSPISLTDVIILGSMLGGGVTGEVGGVPGLTEGSGAAGAALLLLNRARRSPTIATQLYRAGRAGESTVGRQLLTRPAVQATRMEAMQ